MLSIIEEMSKTNQFSHLEQEIINYIFINNEEIAHMTITELAKNTYSSNSTIIRFCQKLGFKGYKDFKIAFIQDLEKNRTYKENIDVNIPFHIFSSPSEISNNIKAVMSLSIETCYKNLDVKKLYKISEYIFNSQHVFCYASGNSLINLQSFENKLIKLGIYLNIATIRWDAEPYSYYATQKDCAIFLTYSARNETYLKNARILKSKRCPIIVISSNKDSELAKIADFLFIIPHHQSDLDNIAEFYSQVAFEYILNVMYSYIYKLHFEVNYERKHKLNTIRLKKNQTQ